MKAMEHIRTSDPLAFHEKVYAKSIRALREIDSTRAQPSEPRLAVDRMRSSPQVRIGAEGAADPNGTASEAPGGAAAAAAAAVVAVDAAAAAAGGAVQHHVRGAVPGPSRPPRTHAGSRSSNSSAAGDSETAVRCIFVLAPAMHYAIWCRA